ncbi:hypothetical protein DICPUDRAFT_79753 [Dictyostelium purpureum]|uniref:SHSP domain-containing protein n=1 Tax=Dictyostelium purpureum TaxID=5786 RepID=F0ZNJ6_DICPU|nr:uncharacterized protein DICPUDRAFT_79753 [Dictyostelium purpureum]EGC34497.1 hypothetical protein DICPUDRAFT_79753 [Dictyostelium purpureum]|eukprot:XP_003288986.1 hypothetical protein DICPUDRAFT_79753 [Dictyostelium purpureum]
MSSMEFNPPKDMKRLQKKMNIFEGSTHMHRINIFRPNVNIKDNTNSITITFELPGINKDHVSVEVTKDNSLVISGEKKSRLSFDSISSLSSTQQSTNTNNNTNSANDSSSTSSTPTIPSNNNNSNNNNTTTTTIRKFIRSFKLPNGTDPSKIKASMDDGLLVIEVPKSSIETDKVKIPILSRL